MQSNTSSTWRRLGYIASFLVVAGVAAYVSFGHIYEVAVIAHQPHALAVVLPLSVDGLMLIATVAVAEDKAANRLPRAWARFGFWLGATVSVAANIASTLVHYGPLPLDLAVAGWAPIALLFAVEIVAKPGKPKVTPTSPAITVTADDAASPELPEAPVSPAISGTERLKRQPYGPRGEAYSPRQDRRIRRGK